MCSRSLSSRIDITKGLQKHVIIVYCPDCERYLQPPRTWINVQLGSNEFLTFCMKRLEDLDMVRLVDAKVIWTEPHSKRFKVKVTVWQRETGDQSYIVKYVVHDQLCGFCSRVQAYPDQWIAVVELRQHVNHRHTFFYLEQLILEHDAAKNATRIMHMDQGIDFFFNNRKHAVKFVDFVGHVSPIKIRNVRRLVSHDGKSNNLNYKYYTYSVEISPICREDLICLPSKFVVSLGNLGPLVICSKVTNSIALLDPFTLRQSYLDADRYYAFPFKALLSSRQLVEYIVLDVEVVSSEVYIGGLKYVLADAQVVRVSDFGKNDTVFKVRTHLGCLLKPGDNALGYDLLGAKNNDIAELDKYKYLDLPDVILIKKSYEEKRQKRRGESRSWKLKSLDMEVDDSARGQVTEETMSSEYEQFLRDLEENPDLRFNVSLYRNKDYQLSEMTSETDGEDIPSVPLDELLRDLDLSDEDVDDD